MILVDNLTCCRATVRSRLQVILPALSWTEFFKASMLFSPVLESATTGLVPLHASQDISDAVHPKQLQPTIIIPLTPAIFLSHIPAVSFGPAQLHSIRLPSTSQKLNWHLSDAVGSIDIQPELS